MEAFYNANLALANPATAQFRWAFLGRGGVIDKRLLVMGSANG